MDEYSALMGTHILGSTPNTNTLGRTADDAVTGCPAPTDDDDALPITFVDCVVVGGVREPLPNREGRGLSAAISLSVRDAKGTINARRTSPSRDSDCALVAISTLSCMELLLL